MASTGAEGDFCFVHAADLHLDTPFKGVSATAPGVGQALREASLQALDQLVQLCLDREAAFLLLAGDIYDGSERGLRAQLRLRDGLARLSDAGIATFVVHGNHDPIGEGWSALRTWPERVHFFGSDAVESCTVERDGVVIATVQGISYPRRDVTENLALLFHGPHDCGGSGVQIGLLHCNVAGAPDGHAAYSPCTLADLRSVGLDYWALGHVHSRTVMSGEPYGAEPYVVYPGNLQARSPKPSERGPKGATVVSVRGGHIVGLEAVDCDVVRFADLRVDVGDIGDVAGVRTALLDQLATEIDESAGRSLIVRAELAGRGAVHRELARDGVLAALLESLRDESLSAVPFAWWDRIEDVSRHDERLDQIPGSHGIGDFADDLLTTASGLGGGTGAPALPVPAAASLGHDVLDEILGKMPVELRTRAMYVLTDELSVGELIEAASGLALDHLQAS